jgi:hypothetical protein
MQRSRCGWPYIAASAAGIKAADQGLIEGLRQRRTTLPLAYCGNLRLS